MTRLLFLGDIGGTGFGTVTLDLGRALLDRGLDVRFVSMNEQAADDLPEPFASRTAVLGQGWLRADAPELRERLEGMFTGGLFEDRWTPDCALILGDFAALKISPIVQFLPDGFPAWHYVPVEGTGLPPAWAGLWRRIKPIAMSEFGATEIERVTGERPIVAYHGVDTSVFHPPSAAHPLTIRGKNEFHVLRSREDCKRLFGIPTDRIMLLRTDRHMPRKMYGALFRALAPVLAAHPNVDFFYHCLPLDQGGDLDDEKSKYGPIVRNEACNRHGSHPVFGGLAARMHSTKMHCLYGGAPRPVLAALYGAADLYVSNSAEGFGLTLAESIACGTPAVGIDYSSVPEVIGPAGVLVPVGALIDNIYSHFWAWVDERKFAETVDGLIRDPARRMVLGAKGPFHVQKFRWDVAAEQIADLIGAREEIAA